MTPAAAGENPRFREAADLLDGGVQEGRTPPRSCWSAGATRFSSSGPPGTPGRRRCSTSHR